MLETPYRTTEQVVAILDYAESPLQYNNSMSESNGVDDTTFKLSAPVESL